VVAQGATSEHYALMARIPGLLADPDVCTIKVKAGMPPERATALESVIGHFADHTPFWVDDSWESQVLVGTLKSQRSKPRTSVIEAASSAKVIRAVRRPRTTELTGISVIWTPPRYTGSWELPWTKLSMSFYDSMWTTFDAALPEGVHTDPRLGPLLLEITARSLAVSAGVTSAAGWFGQYEFEPFMMHQGVAPWDVPGRGYSYIMCFGSAEISKLGGMQAFTDAPVARCQPVATADGEQCIVTLLADAPSTVTDEQLRAWKQFLTPVLAAGVQRRREETFTRTFVLGDVRWKRPPLILPEDWPEPSMRNL
jgi:hypothetical protein